MIEPSPNMTWYKGWSKEMKVSYSRTIVLVITVYFLGR